jgi:hypothetical protein
MCSSLIRFIISSVFFLLRRDRGLLGGNEGYLRCCVNLGTLY